jgi:hypothetical protein
MPEYRDKRDPDEDDIGQTVPISTQNMTNEEIATLKRIALDVKRRQGE